jgi:hypothetical protein
MYATQHLCGVAFIIVYRTKFTPMRLVGRVIY